MAVKLRLTRVGSKKNPIYRVVAADSRSPRDGKFLEIVGRYNPQTDPSTIELDEERVEGLALEGRSADRSGVAASEDQGHCELSCSRISRASSWTTRRRSGSRRQSATTISSLRLHVAAGRRRQGDRPPGPDRPCSAHGRAGERNPRRPARPSRDRRDGGRRSVRRARQRACARGRPRGGGAGGVDTIVYGGDLIWGPDPAETLRAPGRGADARFVRGNGRPRAHDWERSRRSGRSWLPRGAARSRRAGRRPLLPRDPASDEIRDAGDAGRGPGRDPRRGRQRTVVAGHTHMQQTPLLAACVRQRRQRRHAVRGELPAFWALLEDGDVEQRRTRDDEVADRLPQQPSVRRGLAAENVLRRSRAERGDATF